MAVSTGVFTAFAALALAFAIALPAVHGQALPPAPAPTSDGTAIDQGIAYATVELDIADLFKKMVMYQHEKASFRPEFTNPQTIVQLSWHDSTASVNR
ncbi:hypothetical protein RJ640_019008 [Escallonia rubra]|uniref:Uncharacterized protein n=1 Tax=Escallonia rubra TaxID=112253 RepID=A0AA88U096_9ASTE|nr:hypothetical protein RJ640_019008 [Escallonia rubra]